MAFSSSGTGKVLIHLKNGRKRPFRVLSHVSLHSDKNELFCTFLTFCTFVTFFFARRNLFYLSRGGIFSSEEEKRNELPEGRTKERRSTCKEPSPGAPRSGAVRACDVHRTSRPWNSRICGYTCSVGVARGCSQVQRLAFRRASAPEAFHKQPRPSLGCVGRWPVRAGACKACSQTWPQNASQGLSGRYREAGGGIGFPEGPPLSGLATGPCARSPL